MTELASFDEMTLEERIAVFANLSRSLHLSALIARQRGDDNWRMMETLADRLLTEAPDLAAAENSLPAGDVFDEALRLLIDFEFGQTSASRTLQ